VANPTISSAVLTHSYITVTFSEACYNTDGESGALETTDFALTYTDNSDAGSSDAAISSVTTTGNAALAGGETSIRIHITTTGIPLGTATIEIKAVASSIYNAGGEAMADTETTGVKTLNAFLHIYVSKDGNDSNSGLTAALPKLTLGGAKAITATGENKVVIGVGDFSSETITWDGSGKFINLTGDYDAAVFGGSTGTIIHRISTTSLISYVRTAYKIIFYMVGTTSLLDSSSTHVMTLNYCTLRGSGSCFFIGYGGICNLTKVIFNNCTQDTVSIAIIAGRRSTVVIPTTLEFNNYDSITGSVGLKLIGGYSGIKMIFTNCTVAVDTAYALSGRLDIVYTDCTIKGLNIASNIMNQETALTFVTSGGNLAFTGGLCLIKDCTIQDSSGTAYDLNSRYAHVDKHSFRIAETRLRADHLYYTKTIARTIIDNANSNGKRILMMGASTIDGDTETYNSKDVLYYYGSTGTVTSSNRTIHMIKLSGLAVSTEYDVTFSYKKMANSTSADYDIRYGILKSAQLPMDDLYTTPANALTYADYASSDHTYDTWYDKTLTFTTTADANDEYFLTFYNGTYLYQFKMTKPVIAV
jgi:hypothetical protein